MSSTTNNSFIVDEGFQADGTWRVAASRLAPNPAINGSALALTLPYNVLASGDAQLNCSGLAVDSNGRSLNLNVVNGTLINTPPVVPDEPSTLPDDNSDVLTGLVAGIAHFQNRPSNEGITVELLDLMDTPVGDIQTGADGSFNFADLAYGDYVIEITAPQHIPVLQTITLSDTSGQSLDFQLQAGDVDDSGAITMDDILLVAANFGLNTVPEISNVDLNADGVINISDLTLTAGNLDLVSPLNTGS